MSKAARRCHSGRRERAGTASDRHASGSPGEDKTYHRFDRVKGGFLSVSLQWVGAQATIILQHRDVHGAVVYEWKQQRAAAG